MPIPGLRVDLDAFPKLHIYGSCLILYHSLPLPLPVLYKAESPLSTGVACQVTDPGLGPGWIEPVIRCMGFLGPSLEGLRGGVGPGAKQRHSSSWDMRQQEQGAEFAVGVWLNMALITSRHQRTPWHHC